MLDMDETPPQVDTEPGSAQATAEPVAPPPPEPAPAPAAPPEAPLAEGPPPAAAAQPAPAATPEPFRYRADHETYEVDGSTVHPDGSVTVPPHYVEQLKQLLAEGHAHQGSWREREQQYQARIAQLEQAVKTHPDVVQAQQYNQRILALLQQGPEAVAQWLDSYQTNFPALQAQAQQAVLQQQLEAAQRERDELQQQYEAEQLAPKLESALQGIVEELNAKPEYKAVDGGALYGRLLQHFLDRVAYEAPISERRMGLKPGEILLGQSRNGQTLYLIDRGLIEEEFAHWARLSGKSASAATQAVKQNAATLAAAAPPVAAGAPASPAPGSPTVPLPKTREELEKWIATKEWKKSFPQPAGM